VTLIISDVLGDPLDVIGSGPTVPDTATPADALAVLARFGGAAAGVPQAVLAQLQCVEAQGSATQPPACQVTNLVIGNIAAAVDAAGAEAVRRGYSPALMAARQLEGHAEEVGRLLAAEALRMRGEAAPDCLVSGGEPVVRLAPEGVRGRGGRNQQLVLAALAALWDDGAGGIVLLSGGTDGEDGPTDAAGAVLDAELLAEARRRGLDPLDCLRRNDAYTFFDALGGLIRTGPTHTNVCDLRVVLVDRAQAP
jgi:hydroxypyruvate reductase